MKNIKALKNKKGFTLIEIIAVIIIIGVLAVIAVPKFFSMQKDAKIAALNGGLSEAAVRFNLAFAKYIIDEKKAPSDVDGALNNSNYLGPNAATTGEEIGDFVVTWVKGPNNDELTVQIVGASGSVMTNAELDAMDIQYKRKIISGVNWGFP